jgi:hypothetical protein
MSVHCVDCKSGRLRNEASRVIELVRHGLINCIRSPFKASFYDPLTPRECATFELADEASRTARIAFFTKQKEKQ